MGELSEKAVLVRRADPNDRRRRVIDLDDDVRPVVYQWLSPGARAWRDALDPLTPEQRRLVADTLLAYEAAFVNALPDR